VAFDGALAVISAGAFQQRLTFHQKVIFSLSGGVAILSGDSGAAFDGSDPLACVPQCALRGEVRFIIVDHDLCGFRGKAATDSDGRRPPNPIESGHLIRTKAATLLMG
jgi:hypothetical protein